jgi:hypothetical protein
MKTILIALVALGFTASVAFADCPYHTTHNATPNDQAKPSTATQ